MPRPAATRRTSLLLVALCVYQLGASRCGCLEHDGWVQAWRAMSGVACGHASHEGHAALDAHDCDVAAPFAAVTPTRVTVSHDLCGDGAPDSLATADWRARIAGSVFAVARTVGVASTPPLRAQLQVFRL